MDSPVQTFSRLIMAPLSRLACALLSLWTLAANAHTIITYPGWRGDNLHSNGSVYQTNGLSMGDNNTYPYGMQWLYPCRFPFTVSPVTGPHILPRKRSSGTVIPSSIGEN